MRRKPRFYYGWTIVGVAALAGYATSMQMLPVQGVFLKPVTEEFGWSRTAFTSAITAGTVLAVFAAPIVGALLDRFGGRWIVTFGLSALAATMFAVSTVSTFWQFFIPIAAARVMHLGVISTAVMGPLVPMWFIVKRGRALALAGLGPRIGVMVNPVFAQALISFFTWRAAAFGIGSVIAVVSILPAAIFLRRSPESMGLLPDGEAPEEREARILEASTRDDATASDLDASIRLGQAMRHRSYYLLMATFSLAFMIVSGATFHLVPYLTDHGLSSEMAVGALFSWAAFATIGMVVTGMVAERANVRLLLTADLLLMALSFIILMAARSAVPAYVWAISFGLVEGGLFVLQQMIFADYYGRASLGAIRGTIWMMQVAGNAIGSIAGSVAYDLTGSYVLVFAAFGLCSAAGAVCVFFARPPRVQGMATPAAPQPSPGAPTEPAPEDNAPSDGQAANDA